MGADLRRIELRGNGHRARQALRHMRSPTVRVAQALINTVWVVWVTWICYRADKHLDEARRMEAHARRLFDKAMAHVRRLEEEDEGG